MQDFTRDSSFLQLATKATASFYEAQQCLLTIIFLALTLQTVIGASWGGFSTASYLSAGGDFPGKIVVQYLAYFLGAEHALILSDHLSACHPCQQALTAYNLHDAKCRKHQIDDVHVCAGLYFAAGVFLDLFLLGATTFAGVNYSTNAEAFQKAVRQVGNGCVAAARCLISFSGCILLFASTCINGYSDWGCECM